MNEASAGIRAVLTALERADSAEAALLKFVKQLEFDYAESHDITLFVFALRSFFCWHRASEFLKSPEAVARVREAWIKQNDMIYTAWLSSAEDDPELLKWSKWTFQAKLSILKDALEGKY